MGRRYRHASRDRDAEESVLRKRADVRTALRAEDDHAGQQAAITGIGLNSTGLGGALPAAGAATREMVVGRLQQTHGNYAVQRYLQRNAGSSHVVQRDAADTTPAATSGGGWTFNPIRQPPPNVLDARSAVQHVVDKEAKEKAIIFTWLDQHTTEVNLWAMGIQSMDALVAKVRESPDASKLAAERIRHAILSWAAGHNVRPQPGTRASGDVLKGKLEEVVKGALDVAADGVTVTVAESKDADGATKTALEVGIGVDGATAKLKVRGTELSVTAAYDKGVKASLGDDRVKFSAELTPDSWSLKLNIALDPEVPDLHNVGDVFAKAQKDLADLVAHPEKRTQGDVTSALRATSDAFDALQGIAKISHLSASIAAGSTDQGSDAKGGSGPSMPKGWQITVTLSGTF